MYVYVLGYTLYWVHVPMLASLYNSLFFVCGLRMYMYFAQVHKCFHLFRDDNTTCAVCAWTMLANSDMSPVYTLSLVLCALVMCYLQVRHPLRDWRKLGKCQKVIQHSPGGGSYRGVTVNSEGLLAVTDGGNKHVQIFNKQGTLVRSIGEGVLSADLCGITFDLKGNVWVADTGSNKVRKLSQDGRLLQTIDHVSSKSDLFILLIGVSVSPEGLIYICDRGKSRVTVHDEEGMFLFGFGSKGSGPRCFNEPWDVAFGSDGLVYVTDYRNGRVCVWSKEGSFQRDFKTKYAPTYIAATGDNNLLITSYLSDTVLVYKLGGQLVHTFGGYGSDPGRFSVPYGICVGDSGAVYVADSVNKNVQVF